MWLQWTKQVIRAEFLRTAMFMWNNDEVVGQIFRRCVVKREGERSWLWFVPSGGIRTTGSAITTLLCVHTPARGVSHMTRNSPASIWRLWFALWLTHFPVAGSPYVRRIPLLLACFVRERYPFIQGRSFYVVIRKWMNEWMHEWLGLEFVLCSASNGWTVLRICLVGGLFIFILETLCTARRWRVGYYKECVTQ
jgi:hypothetical protein